MIWYGLESADVPFQTFKQAFIVWDFWRESGQTVFTDTMTEDRKTFLGVGMPFGAAVRMCMLRDECVYLPRSLR